jgi:ABC-2 type transport system ATP-binding protein
VIESKAIQIQNVYKRHGNKEILHGVSFAAKKGRVTGFLGQNGAGKSSTLRILLGLDRATSGMATFDGKRYSEFLLPLKEVGAVFDGVGGAKSRKIITHLKMIAQSNDIPCVRVNEMIDFVGLSHKRKAKIGTLSLGEGQRVGLASALLGSPQYLVLDEPANGLDPAGIRWLRDFIRTEANKGKTVLFSSHILAEVEAIADDVVIINNGYIVAQGTLEDVRQNLQSLEDVFFNLTGGNEQ